MRVVVTTVLEIPDHAMNVNHIEQLVTHAARQFPTKAWNAIAQQEELRAEDDHQGRLKRKGRESVWFWTTAGPIRLQRQRYLHAAEARSFLLFDRRIGLETRAGGSPAVQRCFAELAAWGPSIKKACQQIERLLGAAPAVATLWKWTQAIGKKLRQGAESLHRSFFQNGELPGGELPAKPFVAVEADSTFVHAWRQKGKSHEVYLGVAYDGKTGEKRRRLTGKLAIGSVHGAASFGEDLFVGVQARHNVCDAQNVLFLSDGAFALEGLRERHFPMAEHQLDRAHLVRKTREAYGWDLAEAAAKTLKLLLGEKKMRLARQLSLDRERFRHRAGALQELSSYILPHWEWLFVARRLRRNGIDLPPHVEGSGVIERNVGVYIGQRMKHRGMGWTRTGADNILRIRLDLLQTF
jgi:hypothetical protein